MSGRQKPRRMPIPANDPTKRGLRRAGKVDADENILKHELEMRKEDDSTDEEGNWVNIRQILRIIPRNNPNDPYKPHSQRAIQELAEGGQRQHPLLPNEEEMVQQYGYDVDKCTITDKPHPGIHRPEIPKESQFILNRYPAWLRTLIESKYDKLKAEYKDQITNFLKLLAARLEYHQTNYTSLSGAAVGEMEDMADQITQVLYEDEENDDNIVIADRDSEFYRKLSSAITVGLDPFRKAPEPDEIKHSSLSRKESTIPTTYSKMLEEEMKYMQLWSPLLVHQAGDALRASLVAGASSTEDEDYFEEGSDELMRKKELKKGTVRHKDEEFIYRGTHWEAIVAEKSGFQEEAQEIMNEEFMRPRVLKQHRRQKRLEEAEKRKERRKVRREINKANKNNVSGHPLLKQSGESQRDAAVYRERGVGKRPSRLFIRSPCDGPIVEVERRLHQTRSVEALRAYANWIVASITFKYFIMIIIVGNAAILAFESGESRTKYNYAFDIMDSIFLSIYLAEFLLKFFASPNQYFSSGINVFDFVILVLSLCKAVADWADYGNFDYLRFLTIIRALRILRGVTLSVHVQVLVRALLDTLKNHVLSVVLLLVILMYVTSIIAYYLYGNIPGLDGMFGSFDIGMLRLFAFVTMDGWTTIMDTFEEVGKLHEGRLFCLILIILGNFLFSNIFIAIIIMQISDVTDTFRKTQADERDLKLRIKQDEVFRRQKLDMRQLLARQRLGVADDFYELGSQFVRRLRHDDLLDGHEIIFTPLWLDALYKSMQRSHHTSNIIMNQHRKMADRLIRLGNLNDEGRLKVRGISRARYNRYYEIKSKLHLIKEQFMVLRNAPPFEKTRLKLDKNEPKKMKHTRLTLANGPKG